MVIGTILTVLGRIPFVGKFVGSKWFWIVVAVGGTVWFVDYTIDKWGDSIREQVITQFRANEYKNLAETRQLELDSLATLAEDQQDRIDELTEARRRDQVAFQRRLTDLQNSNLESGSVSPLLAEAARLASREDGIRYEDYIANRPEDDEN